MCARWNTKEEGYDPGLPDLLVEKFESIRTIGGFEGFEYQECITVLQSIVYFSTSLPNAVRRGIVHGGVFAAAQAGKITADGVIREISKLESKYKIMLEPEATWIVLWKPSKHYSAVRVPSHYSAVRAFVKARSEPALSSVHSFYNLIGGTIAKC
jgi:hypothetical protein